MELRCSVASPLIHFFLSPLTVMANRFPVRRVLQLLDTPKPPVFTTGGKPQARHPLWIRL